MGRVPDRTGVTQKRPPPPRKASKALDIFLHLPKTAGMTLNVVLHRQFPERGAVFHTAHLHAPDAARQFLDLPPAERGAVRLITGHTEFGLHEFLPAPATYFTVLRDPVERVLSHFYYVRATPDNPRYAEAAGMTLEEFVTSDRFPESDNGQTRLLAGLADGAASDTLLRRAQSNIASRFTVVGLMEEFDASLLLFQRAYGWRPPYYVRLNVNAARPPRAEISARTLAIIREHTALDGLLYDEAARAFREAVQAQGPGFAADLARFQRVNREYQAISRRVSAATSGLRHPFQAVRRALAHRAPEGAFAGGGACRRGLNS